MLSNSETLPTIVVLHKNNDAEACAGQCPSSGTLRRPMGIKTIIVIAARPFRGDAHATKIIEHDERPNPDFQTRPQQA
jgi:hypothetical protein